MARTYSMDLREKVAAHVDRGHSCQETARVFGVSASFVIKLMDRRRRTGSLAPAVRGAPVGRGKLGPHQDWLMAAVEAEPDVTMPELSARLKAARGVGAAPASLSRFLRRCGLTRKKRRYSRASRTVRTSRPSERPG